MPTLIVENLPAAAVPVPPGSTLLAALQAAGHDWLHACGARGRCTTCRVRVLAGLGLLTPLTPAELHYQQAGRLLPEERLSCQARLSAGTVTLFVPKAVQLPHVQYLG